MDEEFKQALIDIEKIASKNSARKSEQLNNEMFYL